MPSTGRSIMYKFQTRNNVRSDQPKLNQRMQDLTIMVSKLSAELSIIKQQLDEQQSLFTMRNANDNMEKWKAHQTIFTFEDVEGSLDLFNGEEGENVESWISRFEENADVCGWNEFQRLIYCKRLLSGAAKYCCEEVKGPQSYTELKRILVMNFKKEIPSYCLHKMLESRKKFTTESLLQYAYKMKKIAMRGNIDDNSLILYIILGIPDSTTNKMILYEASTFDDFKRKIEIYENMKLTYINSTEFHEANGKRDARVFERRCTNCGMTDHFKKGCPDLTRGPKCFTCNNYGHISNSCSLIDKKENRIINEICTIDCKSPYLKVKVNGLEIKALIDTGSEVSVISFRLASKLNVDNINPGTILKGFGGRANSSIGSKILDMDVSDIHYDIEVNIVPDSWTGEDFIIGRNFLDRVKMVFDHGSVKMSIYDENNINVIDSVEKEGLFQSIDLSKMYTNPDDKAQIKKDAGIKRNSKDFANQVKIIIDQRAGILSNRCESFEEINNISYSPNNAEQQRKKKRKKSKVGDDGTHLTKYPLGQRMMRMAECR